MSENEELKRLVGKYVQWSATDDQHILNTKCFNDLVQELQTFAKPSGNERVAPKCGCDGKCLYFSQICEALGWQGGTIHQVLDEIKRLKALSQTQPAHPSPTEDEMAHELAMWAWGKEIPTEFSKFEKFIFRGLKESALAKRKK